MINILLTILGYIPGIIHALYVSDLPRKLVVANAKFQVHHSEVLSTVRAFSKCPLPYLRRVPPSSRHLHDTTALHYIGGWTGKASRKVDSRTRNPGHSIIGAIAFPHSPTNSTADVLQRRMGMMLLVSFVLCLR